MMTEAEKPSGVDEPNWMDCDICQQRLEGDIHLIRPRLEKLEEAGPAKKSRRKGLMRCPDCHTFYVEIAEFNTDEPHLIQTSLTQTSDENAYQLMSGKKTQKAKEWLDELGGKPGDAASSGEEPYDPANPAWKACGICRDLPYYEGYDAFSDGSFNEGFSRLEKLELFRRGRGNQVTIKGLHRCPDCHTFYLEEGENDTNHFASYLLSMGRITPDEAHQYLTGKGSGMKRRWLDDLLRMWKS